MGVHAATVDFLLEEARFLVVGVLSDLAPPAFRLATYAVTPAVAAGLQSVLRVEPRAERVDAKARLL